jgi:hypothetical protein
VCVGAAPPWVVCSLVAVRVQGRHSGVLEVILRLVVDLRVTPGTKPWEDLQQVLRACFLLLAVACHNHQANQSLLWRQRELFDVAVGQGVCAELALAHVVANNPAAVQDVDEAWYRRLFAVYEADDTTGQWDYYFLLPVIASLKARAARRARPSSRAALPAPDPAPPPHPPPAPPPHPHPRPTRLPHQAYRHPRFQALLTAAARIALRPPVPCPRVWAWGLHVV